jgi:molybdopterin-guanine dinucleotide biosynthesis protein A
MVRGLVLCGGESRRMGSDKGTLVIGNHTWSEHAASKLLALDIPVSISVNEMQLSTYQLIFMKEMLVLDRVGAKGPLTGLLSAHQDFPDDDLLVLACDMTEMDVQTLKVVRDCAITFPGFEYYCYVNESFIEPLCALYTAEVLKHLFLALQCRSLTGFSLHRIIKQGHYKGIPVTNPRKFYNHNTP